MTDTAAERVGFIGLGVMGRPMALNLARAGVDLTVWNRSTPAATELEQAGARVVSSPAAVFDRCDTVILMLANQQAVDDVLGPDRDRVVLQGRLVVQMATVDPLWSEHLGEQVAARGGRYAEAPVSGSRVPAQQGTLVGMVAAAPSDLERVVTLVGPMCGSVVPVGAVPAALTMKLAVNTYLIGMVTALTESFHFAERHGLDLEVLRTVLDTGPMASAVSRGKTAKLATDDGAVQASVPDVLMNGRLIETAARRRGLALPLLTESTRLFEETVAAGHSDADMIAVVRALRARTDLNLDNA